ncbi:hypothetical protein C7I55_10220 [Sphingomonas deserti]|uniref:Uncharacterized protein n=1 Tax=Allosphingosinicella deserti TaxID=2116704 RepID=A0A2P7QRW8_9SPHN|nr:hypothetical protein C7I55_10220 [Sphingomonas deserti]
MPWRSTPNVDTRSPAPIMSTAKAHPRTAAANGAIQRNSTNLLVARAVPPCIAPSPLFALRLW